ncbi:MAG: hypothetical protein U0807_11690 [Candidatus Binatia bacterium]
MAKVVPLHESETLALPLGEGARLTVTAFRESPRVALAIYGPGGGDAGGAILHADRARLLASWLHRLADLADGGAVTPRLARSR